MKKATYSIWKEEIVVKLERGINYTSLGIRNGHSDQHFSSEDVPEQLVCQYWGEVIKDGQKYRKYVPKKYITPKIKLVGKKGWLNWTEEADNICQIFQGVTDDGRKILGTRCLTIEDINQLLNVKVENGEIKYYAHDLIEFGYDRKHSNKIYFGENYLLASNAIERLAHCMALFIRSIHYDCVTADIMYFYKRFGKSKIERKINYGIRPVFLIK